ncbi:MAG: NUDIX domain-containing protein [Propionibacteriaceae bacterium]|nr:NUDIX domain-containing protein [Propionibacteriaceae bacterium]
MGKGLVSAGVVVIRGHGDKRTVLSVHRPKLQDWSLPKGHIEVGETLPQTAAREFTEETGFPLLGLSAPLGVLEYPIPAGTKQVHWWLGRLADDAVRGDVLDKTEIDKVRWARAATISRQLSYVDEVPIVQRALATPASVPFVIVRHGKALDRTAWRGAHDADRPLADKGEQQAHALVGLLGAYGPTRVVSSSSERCLTTVLPFAASTSRVVEGLDALSEEGAAADPGRVRTLMRRLRDRALSTREAVVVCGHRPVLADMAHALGAEIAEPMHTAEVLVVHLNVATGAVLAVERHRPCL